MLRRGVMSVVAFLLVAACWQTLAQSMPATAPVSGGLVVRLGVLNVRGQADTVSRWQPTADYLTTSLAVDFPGCRVDLVPLVHGEIESAVAQRQIDFILTNSAQYVQLESRYGCERIATFKNVRFRDKIKKQDIACTEFGGVIFTKADRADINSLADLRGKAFLAAERNSFGGLWMAERELKLNGIDPNSLMVQFTDSGGQEMVVYGVQSGRADAGAIRTDVLERMAADGSIDLTHFKVINPRTPDDEFPFLCSTQLYPEWPMATLKILTPQSEKIAKRMMAALLVMDPKSQAARKSHGAGWAIPLNYEPVRQLLRDLRITPYQDVPKLTLAEATSQHRYLVIGVIAVLLLLLGLTVYVIRLNRRHHRLGAQLRSQLVDQRKAEAALQESEAFYHSLVRNLPQSIIRKDIDGRFTFGNEQFCNELNKTLVELKGKTDMDFFPLALAEKYRADDNMVMSSGRLFEAIEEHIDGNGEKRYVHVIKIPLHDGAGKLIGTQGIFWDVTNRKRAELQLEEQNRLLEQTVLSEHAAHEKLKQTQAMLIQTEKLAALGQMVAGVAHEINNPLSFVSNNVAVLQRDVGMLQQLLLLYNQADDVVLHGRPEIAQQIRELCERVDYGYTMGNLQELTARSREGLKRIQQIVKDLRDFARLDSGDLQEADLNEGIESTVNIIRGRAKSNQIALETRLEPLPTVTCYPAKINQTVLNLLANAIDACDAGGRVTISSRPVTEGDDVKGVEIAVSDTGQGIDPAIRDRIFDPFFTTKPPGEGTGLGLAITYGIIKDHGGTIRVESESGKGSTFVIFLPKASVPIAGSHR